MANSAEISQLIAKNQAVATDFIAALQSQLAGINWSIEGAQPPETPDTALLANLQPWTPAAIPDFTASLVFQPSTQIQTIDTSITPVNLTGLEMREPPAALDLDALFAGITAPTNDIAPPGLSMPPMQAITLPAAPDLAAPAEPVPVNPSLPNAPSPSPPGFDVDFVGSQEPAEALGSDIGRSLDLPLLRLEWGDTLHTGREFAQDIADSAYPGIADLLGPVLDLIRTSLATQPAEGGRPSLLPPEFEETLFTRGRDRARAEQTGANAKTLDEIARRGFVLPPGALMGALRHNRADAGRAVTQHAAEVAVERTKLDLDTRFRLIEVAKGFQDAAIKVQTDFFDLALRANQQVIDRAKAVAELVVARHNYAMDVYRANITLYDTKIRAYDTRLRATLAELDIYKAAIEGAKTLKEFSAVDAQIFEAKVRALTARAQVYETLVKGESLKAEIAKAQADVLRAQVEAFLGTVQAKKAEFEGFAAAVQGKQAVAQAYSAAVQGYAEEARVKISAAQLEVERLRGEVAAKQGQVAVIQAQASVYETEARVAVGNLSAQATAFEAKMQGKRAQNEAYARLYEAEIHRASAAAQASIGSYTAQASYNTATMQQLMNYVEGARTSAIQAAKIAGDVAAAAVAANNTLVHDGILTQE